MGMVLCPLAILWATFCSTQSFDLVLELQDKRGLVAYPVCLFYATFVMITVF